MEKVNANVLILGSGPAGCTAAIYAARGDLSPVLIAGNQPGGQLTITTEVENFPGFPEGVMGPVLMDDMQKQAVRFGTTIVQGEVTSVDFSGSVHIVKTEKQEFHARSVIIATGASARWLGIRGEKEYMGKGVSGCATCDGFFFRQKQITIVGGGDTALEEALFLTKFASRVFLIHRRDSLRGSKIMQERVLNHEKITVIWNSVVEEVLGDENRVTSLKLRNVASGEETNHPTDGFFVAIGHSPNTAIFRDQLKVDDKGYIQVTEMVKTSRPGVFAAGDVHDPIYRQAIVAAGMGCAASLEAARYLENLEAQS
ncbi:MAG: thioredoxin-disulfide reductase [Candidatus Wallbacteria bacterium HGW-Wallbacteria-1]|jgi:thioredoxin reductase (NADPH)|uniref:Thioredoxin reductase n=1 Tax=Candidatus Wallbacteria bacterium HGW-Wallbacteria-1 TaxID=2013854 RepID=A0A2N1PUX8_9BACT|nr:MAG: thioredoxin-disulfide reductase [Candidatus Wallbacteria bacterium HGW-Wallbacteria-1]